MGEQLEMLQEVKGTKCKADIAIIYDTENRWALEDAQGPRNNGLFYHEAVMKSYSAYRKLGYNVDVINEAQDLSDYKIVVAPMLYLFREKIETRLEAFVKNGGHLVMTYWSGVVDEWDRCFLGDTPYGLTQVLGVRRTEIDALYDGETNFIQGTNNERYECQYLCELTQNEGAKTLMTYGKDFYKDELAIAENLYGKGKAYYVGVDAEQAFYDTFYKKVVKEAHLQPILSIETPEGVEVTSRVSEKHEYIFIQNYNTEPVDMPLDGVGEVILGSYRDGIGAYETVILKK